MMATKQHEIYMIKTIFVTQLATSNDGFQGGAIVVRHHQNPIVVQANGGVSCQTWPGNVSKTNMHESKFRLNANS